jgi:glycosyltransferase involved in cell wall biosynthesis
MSRFPLAPKFSILICTSRRCDWLKKAILSCCNQSFADWELLIYNNCSDNLTIDFLSSLSDSRIHYWSSPIDSSVASCISFLAEQSLGEYLLILDDDDFLSPHILSHYLKFADYDLITSAFYAFSTFNDARLDLRNSNYTYQRLLVENCLFHPAIRRDKYFAVGGVNKDYLLAYDYDLVLRLAGSGCTCAYVPKPLWFYRIHPSSISVSRRSLQAFYSYRAVTSFLESSGLSSRYSLKFDYRFLLYETKL